VHAASDYSDFKNWGTKSYSEIRFLLNDELVYHDGFFYEWVYDVCSTVGAP